MNIDRPGLKFRAKQLMSVSKPAPIPVGLIYIAFTMIVSMLSSRLLTSNINADYIMDVANRMMSGADPGVYNEYMEYISTHGPSAGASALNILLQLVSSILWAGFILFCINTVFGRHAEVANLLDGFSIFWKVLILSLLESVIVFFGMLLFIIPGIIMIYRYRMAIYILMDDPEKSPVQCMRESAVLTKGFKWQLFVLDFSFIGWYIVIALPVIGYFAEVYAFPYMNLTRTLYYRELLRFAGKDVGDGQSYVLHENY